MAALNGARPAHRDDGGEPRQEANRSCYPDSQATSQQRTAPDPLEVLKLRAWARGLLHREGLLDLHSAVDVLWESAERAGLVGELGADTVQQILSREFEDGREFEDTYV